MTRPASRASRGFPLLEVMIALAIMTVALVVLLGHQSVAIQMSDFSNRVSQANLLAYGKIQDLRHVLVKDSIDVLDNCEQGDFSNEGFPRFSWEARLSTRDERWYVRRNYQSGSLRNCWYFWGQPHGPKFYEPRPAENGGATPARDLGDPVFPPKT